MFNYPMPPFYGYPPPQITNNDLERGMKIAQRLAQREAREKEREENRKRRMKEEDRRKAEAARSRTLTALEWYILGIICYPIVGPLYTAAINHMNSLH